MNERMKGLFHSVHQYFVSNQGSGQTEDGKERSRGGVSHIFVVSRFFAQFDVGAGDVIRQLGRDDRLLLLAQSDVSAGKKGPARPMMRPLATF